MHSLLFGLCLILSLNSCTLVDHPVGEEVTEQGIEALLEGALQKNVEVEIGGPDG